MGVLEILFAAGLGFGAGPLAVAPADTVVPPDTTARYLGESVCRIHSPGHLALDEVGTALCDFTERGLLIEYYPSWASPTEVALAVADYEGPGEYEAIVVVGQDGVECSGLGRVVLRSPSGDGDLLSGTFVAPVVEDGRIDTVEGAFVCRLPR